MHLLLRVTMENVTIFENKEKLQVVLIVLSVVVGGYLDNICLVLRFIKIYKLLLLCSENMNSE